MQNNNRKRIIFFTALVLIFTSVLSAGNGIDRKEGTHLTDKYREYSNGEIQLMPESTLSETVRQNIVNHGTQFLIEIVYVLPVLPIEMTSLQTLAALLLDIRSLEGIEYWSGGRGRMYPYIKKSYRVEENRSRTPLPSPGLDNGERTVEFIQFQKDTSFGANWYQVNLEIGSDSILLKTLNLTDLKAFTKKTADSEGVLLQIMIVPGDDETLMYCAVSLKEFPPIGWSQGGIAGSFNHRVSALEAWFADRVFGKE